MKKIKFKDLVENLEYVNNGYWLKFNKDDYCYELSLWKTGDNVLYRLDEYRKDAEPYRLFFKTHKELLYYLNK